MSFLWKSHVLLGKDRACYLNGWRCMCLFNQYLVGNKSGRPTRYKLWNRVGIEPRFVSGYRAKPSHNILINPDYFRSLKRNASISSLLLERQENGISNMVRIKKVLQHLELDIQRGNSISKTDLENIIQDIQLLGATNLPDGIDVGLLLLQSCGDLMPDQVPTVRVQLAHFIWNTLQELGITLNVQHYNALLACYVENRHPTSTEEFLQKMTATPDEQTYHLLLWCTCEVGDLEQATVVISGMKEGGFPVSEPMFNALVYGHARTGNVASARDVFETLKSAQLSPSSDTYAALIRGLARVGDVDLMQKTFQEAGSAGAALSSNQIVVIMKNLATSGHESAIPSVLPWLPDLDAEGSRVMKNMLVQLIHLGFDKAVTLMLNKLPIEDSSPFGRFLVREMVKADRPVPSVLALCSLLSERNSLALCQAAEAALHLAKTSVAVDLLRAMKQAQALVRSHYFWPLLLAEGRSKGEEGVFEVLGHMQELGVAVDLVTLSSFVLPHVSLGAPAVLVRRLQSGGLTVSEILGPLVGALISDGRLNTAVRLCGTYQVQLECGPLLRPLSKALLTGANLAAAVALVKIIASSCSQPDDWTGRFMLELLTNKKLKPELGQLRAVIKALSVADLRCSSLAADIVSQHISTRSPSSEDTDDLLQTLAAMTDPELTITPTELFSQHVPHPRDMNLEELECHLIELRAKDMNTRGVLRRLLQLHCRQGNVEKAMSTKQEFESAGHEFTSGMHAALLDLFLQTGRLDEAESSYVEITRLSPNFSIDEHKVIDFAALLIANKKDKMAVSVLEARARTGKVRGGAGVSRNCWRLLHVTSERGEPDVTRRMLDLLVTLDYCSISNILLGPLVRSHLARDDLEGAVAELKLCMSRYKTTPLQHELLCQLVEAADGKGASTAKVSPDRATELVQEVVACTRRAHGAASSQVGLVVALAETGKLKQLQRLVRQAGTKIHIPLLMQRSKRLVDENKLEALQNLVAAFRGISTFNLAPLFTSLLAVHCRRGDCQQALQLWTSMQEMDCQPNSEFLLTLADLLRSHKMNVPFTVPTTYDCQLEQT